jgi:hypothetical protein
LRLYIIVSKYIIIKNKSKLKTYRKYQSELRIKRRKHGSRGERGRSRGKDR